MSKFILITTTFLLVVTIWMGCFSLRENRSTKWRELPDEIAYEIRIHDNIWPDYYYVSSYTSSDYDMTANFPEGYWVYEPGKTPFSNPKWVFYAESLSKKTEHGFSVVTIERATAE
ncbi:MAG: hypothetical protein FWH42_04010 [Dehalococcoidia bacterium]|nr:hypothetical protein [Dehalococcoidia bacterium]